MDREDRERAAGSVNSISGILEDSARRFADAPAILAPGRPPLSYAALLDQARRTTGRLRSLGIAAKDRVAMVLPNGPDMASGFLSVAAGAGCAPLNPAYRKAEFEFYLTDIRAAALVLERDSRSEAADAAQSLGIPILRMLRRESAGEFDLVDADHDSSAEWSTPNDTALLLHTSGTTSRPKLVPLTGANLSASARHIAATLDLTPDDRCLSIMPLFHIHGLMAAVLATIKAGASVVCTDGVYAASFFAWMAEFRPTWYTAVPTMHRALVARAPDHAGLLRELPLRLIRSSSAPLALQLFSALEDSFGAPAIEAYGMTEAAHQVASNLLPPGARKPGSVGLAAGPEVAIMDDAGHLLDTGGAGEVVIRGPNVMSGYEANETANRAAFTEGWFRTGDEGVLDDQGYIRLTGRLKEVINRGGEKISPREVDEVLLAHPAVKQAVVFAIPHAQLGEEVGAAVELVAGADVDASSLRDWAAARLATFKVPRVIRAVDEIPKGPTGKLQRIGLAERLGIAPIDDARGSAGFLAPRSDREERIAAIWRDLLGRLEIGVRDRFEALGGDSLLLVRMLDSVSASEGFDIPYVRFLTEGTIEALAKEIETGLAQPRPVLMPIQPDGSRRPLIWIPGHDSLLLTISRLSAAFGKDQPVWALDIARITDVATLKEMAVKCAALLLQQPELGPWRLVGVCFGGFLALETALLLEEAGARVDCLILIDALNPAWSRRQNWFRVAVARWKQYRSRLGHHMRLLHSASNRSRHLYIRDRVADFLRVRHENRNPTEESARQQRLGGAWEPGSWKGPVVIVREEGRRLEAPAMGWSGCIQELREEEVPFDHSSAFSPERIGLVAGILQKHLQDSPRA